MGKNEFIANIIGSEYLNRTKGIEEETTSIRNAFTEISKINRELFAAIPYEVVFTSEDLYSSAAEMRARVQSEKVIYIYNEWEGHPFLSLEDNLIGRAVHDVFAHLVCGCPFSFTGELTAYNEQRNYYPEWTHPVLFAEIVGQTAAYKANDDSHVFDQRAIAAPKRWMELATFCELPDYSKNSILPSLYKEVI